MLSINEFKVMIEEACPECPEPPGCGELYPDWPDAEPDEKVVYIGPDALFTAACSKGHVLEFYLAELKAGLVMPHTRTERTLGRQLPQLLCQHRKVLLGEVPEGQQTPGLFEVLKGPAKFTFCMACGAKRAATPPPAKPDRGPRLWTP